MCACCVRGLDWDAVTLFVVILDYCGGTYDYLSPPITAVGVLKFKGSTLAPVEMYPFS